MIQKNWLSTKYRFLVMIFSFLFLLEGCASLQTEQEHFMTDYPEPDKIGIYHKVNRGETIWRISKTYNVSINDIIKTNKIPDVAQVEENQLIFVPGADNVKEIVLGVEEDDNENEFIWPAEGKIIGYFHQRNGKKLNKGIDIQLGVGETVSASRKGRVVFADYLSGYGNTVILDHLDGYHSVYAQNMELLVKLGARVKKREGLARRAEEPSATFHFEIRKNSLEENPLHYLP